MINIFALHMAQKSRWIKRAASNSTCKWGHLFQAVCRITKEVLDYKLSEKCLLKYRETKFQQQVLQCCYQIISIPPTFVEEIINEYICQNMYIKIDKSPIVPGYLGKGQKL